VRKGQKHTEETKTMMKNNHADFSKTNNPMYGKKRTEIEKDNMKKNWHKRYLKGYIHPFLGKHLSEKHKEKIRNSQLGGKSRLYKIPRPLEVREKISISHKESYKNGNSNPNLNWIGKHHSEKTKKILRESHLGKITSEETKKKISNILRGKKKSKEWKIKMGNTQKKLWQNEEYAKKMFDIFKIRPNKPELILFDVIKENHLPFNYVGDGQIWFNGGDNGCFNPDFLSKNPKYIIELYGDYWHNLPINKERDKKRLATYSKYGYKTLIIWEHELKNIPKVLNNINSFVSE